MQNASEIESIAKRRFHHLVLRKKQSAILLGLKYLFAHRGIVNAIL
jgi:hypothetical protein